MRSGSIWLRFAVGRALTNGVNVRQACGYGDDAFGSAMMRQAFRVETGPLTDSGTEKSEQAARQHLFAVVIGSYKNPQSHRDVNLEDPEDAIEVILLASHLLRIVDARRPAQQ